MARVEKIGIMTSGGDCSGLNAVIRGATRHAILTHGFEVLGIEYGSNGLLQGRQQTRPLTLADTSTAMLRTGGTILKTVSKGDPSSGDQGPAIVAGFQELGLKGLIAIGGDGSHGILSRLAKLAPLPFVAIPKTIDNDMPGTIKAVGFETAVSVAVEALDRLQTTAQSHDRIMILEVMGRDAGHIALSAGLAGGADAILIPERPCDLAALAAHMTKTLAQDQRSHALVIVAESVRDSAGQSLLQHYADGEKRYGGIGALIAAELSKRTGIEARAQVLGHMQRGGTPVVEDRLMGTMLGVAAVEAICAGKFGTFIGWDGASPVSYTLSDLLPQAPRRVMTNDPRLKTALGLGIFV